MLASDKNDGASRFQVSDFQLDLPKPTFADVLAGLSVAMVLIPQSLAYAEIAGMPLHVGLFASALPALAFALFASSPYLQTGPVAMTSLLTFGALHSAGFSANTQEYVLLGAVLAVLVGLIRGVCGLFRMGWVAYLVSDPVMIGFTSGAAVIIMSSQFPKSVGVSAEVPGGSTVGDALWAVQNPQAWSIGAVAICLVTIVLMVGGRKLHRLFPGVLLAVLGGICLTRFWDYQGPTVGRPSGSGALVQIPEGLPRLSVDLPWGQATSLLVGAVVIAFVGFAEPSAIARTFANEDRTTWNANRELLSSSLANVVSGISGGYPVGGSFSRSSVNRMAGARTRWSGGITGLVVLGFLRIASVLEDLPLAVLGGIVLAAVYRLLKPRTMVRLIRRSGTQAFLAWSTFLVTVLAAPNVQWAVIAGIVMSVAHHLLFKFSVMNLGTENGRLIAKPRGLLWFASRKDFGGQVRRLAEANPEADIALDFSGFVTVDVAVADVVAGVAADIAPNQQVEVIKGPSGARQLIATAIEKEMAARTSGNDNSEERSG